MVSVGRLRGFLSGSLGVPASKSLSIECLSEDVIAQLVQGFLPRDAAQAATEHAASCDNCRRFLSLVIDEQRSQLATTTPRDPNADSSDHALRALLDAIQAGGDERE